MVGLDKFDEDIRETSQNDKSKNNFAQDGKKQ